MDGLETAAGGEIRRVLGSVFGFREFRPHQEQVILHSLAGRDVFAALPTGGGKSLCYQLPALIRSGTTVVVSPLIALMKDQVDALRVAGVAAACLNSSMASAERSSVLAELHAGRLRILYIAPERLAADEAYRHLADWGCTAVAVDEAHCISEWGHEFRPEYRQLSRIREEYPGLPITALTATATARVQDDIIRQLHLNQPHVVRGGFDRPEIFYRVEPKRDVPDRIADFIRARNGASGIVYRATRADVEKTAAFLNSRGIGALPYHAGLPDEVRRRNQDAFRKDEVPVIVATVAFGMGIDKPDIRFVVHGDLPRSLEAYYQETGRAGRDGDDAEALLLWGAGDLAKSRYHIDRLGDENERKRAAAALRKMALFAATFACRRRLLLAHFDEEHPGNCGGCDVCTGEVESVDATEDARKLLSAAARTGERFGAHYLADIVLGSATDRVTGRGHDALPTFGVGAGLPRRHWLDLADDLESTGHLRRDEERFGGLAITAEGRELLAGRSVFRTIRRSQGAPGRRSGRSGAASGIALFGGTGPGGGGVPAADDMSPGDNLLFGRLKDLRLRIAREIGKPPYIVFPDRTLRTMAVSRPKNAGELLSCPGVGETKLRLWGRMFLEVINGTDEQEKKS